jgi:hypothetical protein
MSYSVEGIPHNVIIRYNDTKINLLVEFQGRKGWHIMDDCIEDHHCNIGGTFDEDRAVSKFILKYHSGIAYAVARDRSEMIY